MNIQPANKDLILYSAPEYDAKPVFLWTYRSAPEWNFQATFDNSPFDNAYDNNGPFQFIYTDQGHLQLAEYSPGALEITDTKQNGYTYVKVMSRTASFVSGGWAKDGTYKESEFPAYYQLPEVVVTATKKSNVIIFASLALLALVSLKKRK